MNLSGVIPVVKAALWMKNDAQIRKRGEQTGLVVHVVNDIDLDLKVVVLSYIFRS